MELKNDEGREGIEMQRGGREVEVGQRKEREREGGKEEVDGKKRDDINLN